MSHTDISITDKGPSVPSIYFKSLDLLDVFEVGAYSFIKVSVCSAVRLMDRHHTEMAPGCAVSPIRKVSIVLNR